MRGAGLILLVEDNEDDELMTLEALRGGTRAAIEVARDGEEALNWLFGRGEHAGRDILQQPDVVLLDIKLPKRSGLEVLAAIRADARTHFLPVVMLTSSNEPVDLMRAYHLQANSYVRKPVRYEEFARVVGLLGSYWTGWNETSGQENKL